MIDHTAILIHIDVASKMDREYIDLLGPRNITYLKEIHYHTNPEPRIRYLHKLQSRIPPKRIF
jgi:hypothetical protein